MLILFLFFALFQHLQGAPLVDTESSAAASFGSSDCSFIIPCSHIEFGTRTKADIIITCLATIFACTWTAIHPNIPAPNNSQFDIFKQRVRMTFYALLAPEAITTFAFRQRLAASEIAKEYNGWGEQQERKVLAEGTTAPTPQLATSAPILTIEGVGLFTNEILHSVTAHVVSHVPSLATNPMRNGWIHVAQQNTVKWLLWLATPAMDWFRRPTLAPRQEGQIEQWTTTHGFFVQMGGFMLSKNGMPLITIHDEPFIRYTHNGRRLEYPGIKDLIDKKKIYVPTMTKADIDDRSKGDVISKTVVILQTTWFLAQCIARWSTGLAVTELEVITLGFVVLNGLTYACWWHKPQNVGVPVYLEWVSTSQEPPELLNDETKISHIDTNLFGRSVTALLVPIASLLTGEYTNYVPLRISMFYSKDSEGSTGNTLSLTMSAVAVVFGVVHLVPAWFLIFPSHTAKVIWRTCATVTNVLPITAVPLISIVKRTGHGWVGELFLMIITTSYITSRIALFVLAFICLHHLSPQALTTIEWLSVFPHI